MKKIPKLTPEQEKELEENKDYIILEISDLSDKLEKDATTLKKKVDEFLKKVKEV